MRGRGTRSPVRPRAHAAFGYVTRRLATPLLAAAVALTAVHPARGDGTVLVTNGTPSPDGIGFSSIEGLPIAPDGTNYVAASNAYDGGGGIFRVDPVTGERTMISNNDSPAVGTVPDYDNP